jgi:uncharacterized membrane protein
MSTQTQTGKPKTAVQPKMFTDEIGLERLIFFSDAVFAIAITLLALEIRLPIAAEDLSNQALLQTLLAIVPKYISYIISFLVIGNFWIWHHARFRSIVRYDNRVFVLNLFLLMAVAFIPFPTEVISENGNRTATIFYALSITMTGLFALLLWVYAAQHHRLTRPLEPHEIRRSMTNTLIIPLVFLTSIVIAYLDPDLAKYSWGFTALTLINPR